MMAERGGRGGRTLLLFRAGTAPLFLLGLIGMFQVEAPALALPVLALASAAPVEARPAFVAADGSALEPVKRASRARCAECGVLASMRAVESEVGGGTAATGADGTKRPVAHEFTVRYADGSHRVVTDANPAAWRLGERMSIIDGI